MVDQKVESLLENMGFENFGWTELKQPETIGHYQQWLDDGYHGKMQYLVDHLEAKKDPKDYFNGMKSVILIGVDYIPHPHPIEGFRLSNLQIAEYAKGGDYHFWLKERLDQVVDQLKKMYPEDRFQTMTDSAPFLERDFARKAGMGWFGKNTCLIDRKRGSLFLIGEILTSLELENQWDVSPDHCGKCTACIDACPTNAFEGDRKLNANKCISYLTIEASEVPSVDLRENMGGWIFGCDICQTVCPWNIKAFKNKVSSRPLRLSEQMISELRWILTTSNKQIQKELQGTALSRSAGTKLKRNALVVVGNLEITQLITEVRRFIDHEKLGELAQWCLNKIESK